MSNANKSKLKEIREFRGVLKVTGSGLRIGGAKESAGIGETDNPIIRHPITRRPYVPGSSIKGKLRSLLEVRYGLYIQVENFKDKSISGKPCSCGKCFVCILFGCGDTKKLVSQTRLIFRDCQPTENTLEAWENAGVDSEVKTEVLIDRVKGNALGNIGPRTMERIPAGSDFDFSFSLRVFEGDNLKEHLTRLAEGFELLEKDYLGGSGSRGYGQVRIVATDQNGKEISSMAEYLKQQAGS